MKIGVVVVGLAVCWPASADVTDFLRIRYEGTVSSISGTSLPEYSVGDRVSGTLLVDLRLAPPDSQPDARWGLYRVFPEDGISRFVTGYAPSRGFSGDFVGVTNGFEGPLDSFAVEDSAFGLSDLGNGHTRRFEDTLFLNTRQGPDFLDNVDLAQSFDLRGPDVGRGLISRTRELYEDGKAILGTLREGVVEFVLQRFTVRSGPGRCSA